MSPNPASRVLVADDVKDSADTLAELLAAQGVEARAVYDGHAALRLAQSWQPNGAVLDLALPGLTGFELARELRGRFGETIRLVAYTGWAGEREKARACGFDEFLVKPVDPATLLLALGRPVSEMVSRSLAVRLEQMERQLQLGHSLLDHGMARPEALAVICGFLERAFRACRETLAGMPLADDERNRLQRELDRIEARLAQVRGGAASGEG
jgi:CheY-like chemotaxis protein